MTTTQDQIVRKTMSLPESLWKELGDYRFHHRFPTETGAVLAVLLRGLKAGAVFNAIADIAVGRRKGRGKFTVAAARTIGDGKNMLDLVEDDIRDWSVARGLALTDAQIRQKAEEVHQAAERLAGGQASLGQAAVLDIAVEWLIEWAFQTAAPAQANFRGRLARNR
jgi:hypothetical protein